jgi:hypothetical protein
MGKGSGACDRPGISLEASGTKTEGTLSGGVASANEINTTLKLQRIGKHWWTKDEVVIFRKRKEGWAADAFLGPICKAFEEYGIIGINSDEHTYFPSLKAARQAVTDVSLEAGLNIDSRLMRGKDISYKIGDLPLHIRRNQGHWRAYRDSSDLPPSLEKHFNSVEELRVAWESTDIVLVHYPTRKDAHQAVLNWLSQTILKK